MKNNLRPESNYTTYPNVILDNLHLFKGAELSVISWIIRQNVGYSENQNTRFSSRYISMNTGLSRNSSRNALVELCKKGIIFEVGKEGERDIREFEINWGWSLPADAKEKIMPKIWTKEKATKPNEPRKRIGQKKPIGQKMTHASSEIDPSVGQKLTQIKETINEKNKLIKQRENSNNRLSVDAFKEKPKTTKNKVVPINIIKYKNSDCTRIIDNWLQTIQTDLKINYSGVKNKASLSKITRYCNDSGSTKCLELRLKNYKLFMRSGNKFYSDGAPALGKIVSDFCWDQLQLPPAQAGNDNRDYAQDQHTTEQGGIRMGVQL